MIIIAGLVMVIGLRSLCCYLAEGTAKGDSSTRHEWKTQRGRPHTNALVPPRQSGPTHSSSRTQTHSYAQARGRARTPILTDTKHPSCLVGVTWQNCLQAAAAILRDRPVDKRPTTNSWPVSWTIWLPIGARETPNASCPILKEFIFIRQGIICNQ